MRISDWSSDVCSSDLPATGSIDSVDSPPHQLWSFGHQRSTSSTSARHAASASTGTSREFSTVNPAGDESTTRAAAGASEQASRTHSSRILYMSFPRWHAGVPQAHATRKCGLRGESSRSEEHTSELQSLMRISYAVFCLKTKRSTLNIT